MVELIVRKVTRYLCPYCRRGHSKLPASANHVARCFKNPEAQGCKTCVFYQPAEEANYVDGYPGCRESCGEGISLADGLRSGCDLHSLEV